MHSNSRIFVYHLDSSAAPALSTNPCQLYCYRVIDGSSHSIAWSTRNSILWPGIFSCIIAAITLSWTIFHDGKTRREEEEKRDAVAKQCEERLAATDDEHTLCHVDQQRKKAIAVFLDSHSKLTLRSMILDSLSESHPQDYTLNAPMPAQPMHSAGPTTLASNN